MTRGRGAAVLAATLAVGSCRRAPPQDLRTAGYHDLERGQLEAALAEADAGLALARRGGDAEAAAAFQVLKAEVFLSQRRTLDALTALETAVPEGAGNSATLTRALMTRGLARCQTPEGSGNSDRGLADLDAAYASPAAAADDGLRTEVALRRGTCHMLRQRWTDAESDFRAGLATARRDGLRYLEANLAGSIGLLSLFRARYDEGVEWLQRALTISASLDADVPRIKTMNNLGLAYYLLGDSERALSLLADALANPKMRELPGDRLTALNVAGNAHAQRGRFDRAAQCYGEALAIAERLQRVSDAILMLVNLAETELELRRFDAAHSHLRESMPLIERVGDGETRALALFVEGKIWAAEARWPVAEERFRSLLASPGTPAPLSWELHGALARAYMATSRAREADAEFRAALGSLEAVRVGLARADDRITMFSMLRRFYEDYVEFLVASGDRERALWVVEQSRGRMLRERLGDSGPEVAGNVDALRRSARAAGAVLLSYWLAPRRSFLWVVTAERVELHVLPDEPTLRRAIEAYQAAIQRSRDPIEEGSLDGQRLWQSLLAPAGDVPFGGKRVVLVADGALHQLNFETLPVPGDRPHYWIEDAVVAEAPSLALLSGGPAPRVNGTPSVLLIGDPSPVGAFPRLAHASRELAGIENLFGADATRVFAGDAAVPRAYRDARPERFRYIHFASHATANRESPLDSAIVLSPAGDEYKLYARDIVQSPIHAELVTLSACRSAGSRTFAGEGLVGLSWAFLGSGARNVIAGLWNVEDASTAELMERLYNGLKDGRDPAAALREAKLALVRSSTPYRKPFYWAPFVLYSRAPRDIGPGGSAAPR